jgi:hypothetical protein
VIVDHPTVKIQVRAPWGYEPAKVVKCDSCGHTAKRTGSDAGEAAEGARKEGFQTVRIGLGDPLMWKCSSCLAKKGTSK